MAKIKTAAAASALRMACVVVLACSISVSSCIKDADDDGQPQLSDDTTLQETDSAAVVIDSTFAATAEYMQTEWMAQYSGYDPQQSASSGSDVVSAIRRLVHLSPDGTYESHVQGIVNVSDTITTYKEFEHESGTYTFDPERQMMTYTVEYDSLLDFGTDRMERHNGKVKGPATLPLYGERVWFSYEQDGRRDWVRQDDNLMSTHDHTARLFYTMKSAQ